MNKVEVDALGNITGVNNSKATIEVPSDIPIIAINAYKYDLLRKQFFLDPEKNDPANPLYKPVFKDATLQFKGKSE